MGLAAMDIILLTVVVVSTPARWCRRPEPMEGDPMAARCLLLTNDDGLETPGLAALQAAAEGFAPYRVVAPIGPQSSCGHAVTTNRPIPIERDTQGRTAVHGTPADCVRLALHHLAPATTCVVSGINSGGNLGVDIHHSGTVAAVREAVIHGVPGVAISLYIARGREIDWDQAARRATRVLRFLEEWPWEPGTYWNVNLPHPATGVAEPEIVLCPLDPSPLPLSFAVEAASARYNGDYQARLRIPGSDVDRCFRGAITISRVRLLPGDATPQSWDTANPTPLQGPSLVGSPVGKA
jgi:5'-nucleotidase